MKLPKSCRRKGFMDREGKERRIKEVDRNTTEKKWETQFGETETYSLLEVLLALKET